MQQSVNRKHTHTRTSKVGDTPAVKLTSPQSGHQLSTMTSLPPMTSATQAKRKTERERHRRWQPTSISHFSLNWPESEKAAHELDNLINMGICPLAPLFSNLTILYRLLLYAKCNYKYSSSQDCEVVKAPENEVET